MEHSEKTKLQKLKEKQRALNAQIRQIAAQERELLRKRDSRRKLLIGVAVLKRIERQPEYHQEMMQMVEQGLVRDDERAVFGLPPLASSPPKLSIVQPDKAGVATSEDGASGEGRTPLSLIG